MDDALPGLSETPRYPMPRDPGCPLDPPSGLARLCRDSPVSRVRIWNDSSPWLITSYGDQRTVLADSRFSAEDHRPGYPVQSAAMNQRRRGLPTFITMDGPEHARLRRIVVGDFAMRQAEALRPKVQQIVDSLIDAMLARKPPVDLVQAFAQPVPALVTCELLGAPYEDHEFFEEQIRTYGSRTVPREDAAAAVRRLGDYLSDLVAAKVRQPADDLLSRLAVEHVRTGSLTQEEAARTAGLLLEAGFDTTANMIALGTIALLQHPAQLAEIRESGDPALVAGAVEELLRYLTIAHNGRRRVALEDVEVAGIVIRAGEGVICSNDAGNRDPREFPHPDRLDIHRDARRHLAFGFGPHQCAGQSLARVELQVVCGTLYRRIPELRLAVDIEEIPFDFDGVVCRVSELPVTWQ